MTPEYGATVQRDTLSYQVAQRIAEEVSTLAPGIRLLAQGEFADQMGISRQVVREAFRLLEARGIIEIQQGRVAVVRGLDHSLLAQFFDLSMARGQNSVAQLLELRSIIEVSIARLAAMRATPDHLAAMREAIDMMITNWNDPEKFIDADIRFHACLAEASGNSLLTHVIAALLEPLRAGQVVTRRGAGLRGEDTNEVARRGHEAVFQAVASHNPEAADAAMRGHLRDTIADLRAHGSEDVGDFNFAILDEY